jgi:uncharacterized protein (DUF1330 family)
MKISNPMARWSIGMLVAVAGALALHAANAPSPKGYVIGEIQITDQQTYQTYAARTTPILEKFGGRYVVRGGQTVSLEGAPPAGRVVVIEFPSLAAARAFHDSPEYKAIAEIRHKSSTGRAFIVEGFAQQ